MKKRKLLMLSIFVILIGGSLQAKAESAAQDSVYLMSYFRGNAQHLYYAYSEDGLSWNDINMSEPIFDAYDKTIWLRDPFMKRITHKGETKFHMVHTWGWDNPAIYHWESDDLITWKATNGGTTTEDGRIYVMDGKNGNMKSKNAWAPEFFYEEETKTFYIYWASDDGSGYLRHHYCTTQDWTNFTPSKVYFDPGFTAIDLTILKYNGMYYGYYKDERGGQKKIRLATSKSLDPKIQRFDGIKEVLPTQYREEVEGPETFRMIGQNKWFLYWDKFIDDQGISFASISDPSANDWSLIADSQVKNPTGVKHGSVEIISRKELDVLLAHFDKERLTVLPNADIEAQEWKYTTSLPVSGWYYKTDYDDSSWSTGLSGFGVGTSAGTVVNTLWETPEIYLRKKFNVGNLTKEEINGMLIRLCHDDDVVIYINGQIAYSRVGYSAIYRTYNISQAAKNSIKPNAENIISVKCIQKEGGQYIDVGLQTFKTMGTGINDEMYSSQECRMFYNQTDSLLNVDVDEHMDITDARVRIFNSSGYLIYNSIAQKQIDLSSFDKGVYIAVLYKDSDKCSRLSFTK